MRCWGSVIHASRVLSFHTTPDDFTASEKRAKLARSPAFRFHSPDRLRPGKLLFGSNERHAGRAPNARWPGAGLPSAAQAAADWATTMIAETRRSTIQRTALAP